MSSLPPFLPRLLFSRSLLPLSVLPVIYFARLCQCRRCGLLSRFVYHLFVLSFHVYLTPSLVDMQVGCEPDSTRLDVEYSPTTCHFFPFLVLYYYHCRNRIGRFSTNQSKSDQSLTYRRRVTISSETPNLLLSSCISTSLLNAAKKSYSPVVPRLYTERP